MTTINDVKALADDLICAAANDEVESARQKFDEAIEQYAAEQYAAAVLAEREKSEAMLNEILGVISYCNRVQQHGTPNERTVAQAVARMLSRPPAAIRTEPKESHDV